MATSTPDTEISTLRLPLLIERLEIENFRCFKKLVVPKFGKVNLITGRNNIGKTSFLEAIWSFGNAFDINKMSEILVRRENRLNKSQISNFGFFDSFFYEVNSGNSRLDINDGENQGVIEKFVGRSCNFYFGAYPIKSSADYNSGAYLRSETIGKKNYRILHKWTGQNIKESDLKEAWARIEYTADEDFVLDALKVIEPNLIRIGLQKEGNIFVVRLKGTINPVPLKSHGDGIGNMLSFILPMVESKDSAIVIDEIENGIHYSVLYDMWKMVFHASKLMNVQVFAATHSWDCIEAFQKAAAEDDDLDSGMLIRLEKSNEGDITAVTFDENDLEIVTRRGIEVR